MKKSLVTLHPTLKEIVTFTQKYHNIDNKSIQKLHHVFWTSFSIQDKTDDLTIRTENRTTLHKAFEIYNNKVIKTDNEYHVKRNFIDFMLDKYTIQDGLVVENTKNITRKNILQNFS